MPAVFATCLRAIWRREEGTDADTGFLVTAELGLAVLHALTKRSSRKK